MNTPTTDERFNTIGHDLRDQWERLIDDTIEAKENEIAHLRALKADMRALTFPVLGLPTLALPKADAEISRIAAKFAPPRFGEGPVAPEVVAGDLVAKSALAMAGGADMLRRARARVIAGIVGLARTA